jgi:hypothetical protein
MSATLPKVGESQARIASCAHQRLLSTALRRLLLLEQLESHRSASARWRQAQSNLADARAFAAMRPDQSKLMVLRSVRGAELAARLLSTIAHGALGPIAKAGDVEPRLCRHNPLALSTFRSGIPRSRKAPEKRSTRRAQIRRHLPS